MALNILILFGEIFALHLKYKKFKELFVQVRIHIDHLTGHHQNLHETH